MENVRLQDCVIYFTPDGIERKGHVRGIMGSYPNIAERVVRVSRSDEKKIDTLPIRDVIIEQQSYLYTSHKALKRVRSWPEKPVIFLDNHQYYILTDIFLKKSYVYIISTDIFSLDLTNIKINQFEKEFSDRKIYAESEEAYTSAKYEYITQEVIDWVTTDKNILASEPVCRSYRIQL